MKVNPPKTDASGGQPSQSVSRVRHRQVKGRKIDEGGVLEDRGLVERCLAGEVAAWEEFYTRCHPKLLVLVRGMLDPGSADPNFVDELAARVWYALVADDGALLERYDPSRGARLTTFLRAIAKDVLSRHFRSERRRLKRERVALREKPRHHEPEVEHPNTSLPDFLETLTPGERAFCAEYLLAPSAEGDSQSFPARSSASIWQLTYRIRQKLLRFVHGES